MKTITLDTTYGTLRGMQHEGYQTFTGIRYATAERFQKPVLCEHCDGIYDATTYGNICPQPAQDENGFYYREFWHHKEHEGKQDEDCLHLNIWKPDQGRDLPVAVWIHGGAFKQGYCSKIEIDGARFAGQGIILVSINYRLGILGFLCHPALLDRYGYCGNYAIYDQLCAVRWVKEHIASFGGNPEHITLMGQSAGAMSVQTLLSSPLLSDGITGAVMQSGGGIDNYMNEDKSLESQLTLHADVLASMGITSLEQLLDADFRTLVNGSERYAKAHPVNGLLFSPVIDGAVLPDTYEALLQNGRTADVPCIIGCTKDDITVSPQTGVQASPVYKGCLNWAALTQEAGHIPSYVYLFRRAPAGGEGQGAFHSADLWYSFGSLEKSWRQKSPADYRLADEMNLRWGQFIRTGSPNPAGYGRWEPYTDEQPVVWDLI